MKKLFENLQKILLIYILVFSQSFSSLVWASDVKDNQMQPSGAFKEFKINNETVSELIALCKNKTITEIQAMEDENIKILCTEFMKEMPITPNLTNNDSDCFDCETKMAQPKSKAGIEKSNVTDLAKVVVNPESAATTGAVCANKNLNSYQCLGDVMCALSPTGCAKYGNNNCWLTLFRGIFESLKGTWEGVKMLGKLAYSGMKAGGKWAKDKVTSWFSSDTEKKLQNEMSNRAHIASQAKTNEINKENKKKGEGIIDMAKRFINQIWDGIWKSAMETFACEKWAGAPHTSKCLAYSQSLECADCFQRTNLVCGVGGYILSDVLIASTGLGLAVNAASYAPKALAKIPGVLKAVELSKSLGRGVVKFTKASGKAVAAPVKGMVKTVNTGAASGSKLAQGTKAIGSGIGEVAKVSVKTLKLLGSAGIKIVGKIAKVPLKMFEIIASAPGIKQYLNWSDKAFNWGRHLSWGKKATTAFNAGSTLGVKVGGKADEVLDVVVHSTGANGSKAAKESEVIEKAFEEVKDLSNAPRRAEGGVSNASAEGRSIEGSIEAIEDVPLKLNEQQFNLIKQDKDFAPLVSKFDKLEDQKIVAEIIDQVKGPNYVSPTKGRKLTSSKEVVEEVDDLIRKACPIKK